MTDEATDRGTSLAYLTEEERREVTHCIDRRNDIFQDPRCDEALALLGSDRTWVEQALRYPAVYYVDASRRRDFEAAILALGDAISQVQNRQRECCAD